MDIRVPLHAPRFAALVASLLLVTPSFSPLSAQQVGRWEVADSAWVFPAAVDAADASHFALVERMNSEDAPYIAERVRVSDDGGRTWRVALLDTTVDIAYKHIEHAAPNSIVVLAERDTMVEIPNGWEGYPVEWTVIVTTDGGATWRRASTRRHVAGLAMISGTKGFKLGSGPVDSLFATSDGGITWTGRELDHDIGLVEHFSALDDHTVAAQSYDTVADRYRMHVSSDAGATWTTSDPLPSGTSQVALVDATTFVAAGGWVREANRYRDIIRRSSDAGATWTTVLDVKPKYFGQRGVEFADRLNGLTHGSGEDLYRTVDGGFTWTREPLPWSVGIYNSVPDIANPSPSAAVALIQYQKILRFGGEFTLSPPVLTQPSSGRDQVPIEARLEWTPVEGATGYHLQIGDTTYDYNTYAPEAYAEPYFEDSLNTTYRDVTLEYNRRYQARVRSYNATQMSDWSSDLFFLSVKSESTLPHPEFVRPAEGEQVSLPVTFEWSAIPGAIAYDLAIADNPYFRPTLRTLTDLTTTSQTVADLAPSTEYYASIRARSLDDVSTRGRVGFTTAATSGVDASSSTESILSIAVAPNPVSSREDIGVRLDLRRSGIVTLGVFAISGARVTPPLERMLEAGASALTLRLPKLAPGTYFVRASTGDAVASTIVQILP